MRCLVQQWIHVLQEALDEFQYFLRCGELESWGDQTDNTGLRGTSSGTASIGTGRASVSGGSSALDALELPSSRPDGEGGALSTEVIATIFQGASP